MEPPESIVCPLARTPQDGPVIQQPGVHRRRRRFVDRKGPLGSPHDEHYGRSLLEGEPFVRWIGHGGRNRIAMGMDRGTGGRQPVGGFGKAEMNLSRPSRKPPRRYAGAGVLFLEHDRDAANAGDRQQGPGRVPSGPDDHGRLLFADGASAGTPQPWHQRNPAGIPPPLATVNRLRGKEMIAI